MKNIKQFVWLFIIIFGATRLSSQCNEFVKIDGKKFKCGQSDFFAVVCNYVTDVMHPCGGNQMPISFPNHFPTRAHPYSPDNKFSPEILNQTQAFQSMVKDFTDMKQLGFNTVRITGACRYLQTIVSMDCEETINYNISYQDANYNSLLLDITENILNAAAAADNGNGIKVILLLGEHDVIPYAGFESNGPYPQPPTQFTNGYINYLQQFATRFKNNKTLLGIDFVNEPDVHVYGVNKSDICNLVQSWNNAIKSTSNILTTIGLWNVGSVFSWDANVMQIDFASFHNYPYFLLNDNADFNDATNRIKSDYYYFKNNLSLPWMVGETGMSAHPYNISHPLNTAFTTNSNGLWDDGPSRGTIAEQKSYLNISLNACRDYGAVGYSWWQFTDEHAGINYINTHDPSNPNHLCGPFWGLAYSNEGNTPVQWKPAAQEITNFNPTPNSTNSMPTNFYNYDNIPNTFYVTGKIIDQNNVGVKNALIEALDANGKYTKTFADDFGNYMVRANAIIVDVDYTALDHSSVTNDVSLLNNSSPIIVNFNRQIIKIPTRPTVNTINKSNQVVSNANENIYATNDINFSNYTIQSGIYNSKAGSVIKLNSGFKSLYGTNFSARIGAYYHDCNTLVANGMKESHATSISEVTSETTGLQVYPNPSNGKYIVSISQNHIEQIVVMNIYGALLKSIPVNNAETEVNIQEFSAGIYFLNFKNSNGIIKESIKVIKE